MQKNHLNFLKKRLQYFVLNSTKPMEYQLIIIGTGSAGLPAAMYAARYGIKTLAIGALPGGALATSHCVENYPGILSENGKTIMDRFLEHAQKAGAEVKQDFVSKVTFEENVFSVQTASGQVYQADFVLLATGNKYRKLGIEGEKRLLGAGVSYCATCDGMFFRNRKIAIVGGGDTAITEALYLAEICAEVHIIHRKDAFKAEQIWVDKLKEHANITVHFNTVTKEVLGDFAVEKLRFEDGSELEVDGFFVAIGSDPDTKVIDGLNVEKDTDGTIRVDKRQQTGFKKLYAAGDVTTNSNKFKQTIMSAAEGALAANSIHEDILKGE